MNSVLPALLQEKRAPPNSADRTLLARTLAALDQNTKAAGHFEEVVKSLPGLTDDVRRRLLLEAAEAALAAASIQGGAITKQQLDATHWQEKALAWIQADIAVWKRCVVKGSAYDHQQLPLSMQRLRENTNFRTLLSPEHLAQLPADERTAWQKVAGDIDDLLQKAKAFSSETKRP